MWLTAISGSWVVEGSTSATDTLLPLVVVGATELTGAAHSLEVEVVTARPQVGLDYVAAWHAHSLSESYDPGLDSRKC